MASKSIRVGAVAVARAKLLVSPGVSSHLIDETVDETETVAKNGSSHTRLSALQQKRVVTLSEEEEKAARKLGSELRKRLDSRPFFFVEGTRYVAKSDIAEARTIIAEVQAEIAAYNADAEYTSIRFQGRPGIIDLDVDTQAHVADLQQEIGSRLEALQHSVDAHTAVLCRLERAGSLEGGIEGWNASHDASRTILRAALTKVAETEIMLGDDDSRRALGTIIGGVKKRLKMARGLATAPAEAKVDVVSALSKRKGAIMEFADVARPPATNAQQALDEATRLKAEVESALTSMGRLSDLMEPAELVARIETKAAEVEARFAELETLAGQDASTEQIALIRTYAARAADRALASYRPSQDSPEADAATVEPSPAPSAPAGAESATTQSVGKTMEFE